MTSPFDFVESDEWPALKARITAERARRIEGLLYVGSMEGLKHEQGWVECLDWVLEEAKPKPQPVEEDADE